MLPGVAVASRSARISPAVHSAPFAPLTAGAWQGTPERVRARQRGAFSSWCRSSCNGLEKAHDSASKIRLRISLDITTTVPSLTYASRDGHFARANLPTRARWFLLFGVGCGRKGNYSSLLAARFFDAGDRYVISERKAETCASICAADRQAEAPCYPSASTTRLPNH